MDRTAQLNAMIELFGRLDVDLRRERLGGAGGGLCRLRGRRVVFIDLDADLGTQIDRCLHALAALPELDRVYVAPALREWIDRVHDSDHDW